jgi:hypothetical protein
VTMLRLLGHEAVISGQDNVHPSRLHFGIRH